MKKIIVFLLFFFVPSLVFAADCTIGQFADGTVTNTAECDKFVIDSMDRIDEVTFNNNEFKDIEFNGVVVDDLSFLSSARAERVIFINSKVNLSNWDIFSPIVFFRATYIVDDDLSGLAKNTIMENLSFDNCWLVTLETLEELDEIPTLTNITIAANRYLHLSLDPIMYLPHITNIGLNYMQQNVDNAFIDYVDENEITVDIVAADSSHLALGLMELSPDFEDYIKMSEIEQIRTVVLSIIDRFDVVDVTRTDPKSLVDALDSNQASVVEFSLLLSHALQGMNFKTAHILGHKSGAAAGTTLYVMVFYNNSWHVIDIYSLENDATALEAVRNGESSDYFMKEASAVFVDGAALDEKLIDYMDYSFHLGYVLPDGVLRLQILPLDLSTYSLLEGNAEGYTFHGWYLDPEYTIPFTNDNQINKNHLLYGKFESNKATPVPDDGGNGTVTPPDTGMFMGLWIILPIVALIGIEWYRNKRFNSIGGI